MKVVAGNIQSTLKQTLASQLSQALKYRSVTDIVRPIREIVRRSEETTGHSVRPK
jgi:hypothetical protein